jgi:fucose 4-O-acetylase-like acetyltransferase
MGEFCFGIAFAYGMKRPALLFSALMLVVRPIMFWPFAIFYLASFVKKGYFLSKTFALVGSNTLAIFLFHEAFIKVSFDKWHVGAMSWIGSLIVLILFTVVLVYLSKKIQMYLFSWEKLKH